MKKLLYLSMFFLVLFMSGCEYFLPSTSIQPTTEQSTTNISTEQPTTGNGEITTSEPITEVPTSSVVSEIPTTIPTTGNDDTSDETTSPITSDNNTSNETTNQLPTNEEPTTDTTTSEEVTTDYSDPDEAIDIDEYEYRIDFEDQHKYFYTEEVVEFYNIPFILNDALIGESDSDVKYGDKSLRIRQGYFQSEISVSDLKKVSFSVAGYDGNVQGTFIFEFSFDKVEWLTYGGEKTVTGSFQRWIYHFDTIYEHHEIDSSTPVYFRIKSNDENMINIENLRIAFGSQGEINYPESHRINIYVESNHPFAPANIYPSTKVSVSSLVTINASDYEGYRFTHWEDEYTNTIFSYHQELTFSADRPMYLIAYYERIE